MHTKGGKATKGKGVTRWKKGRRMIGRMYTYREWREEERWNE